MHDQSREPLYVISVAAARVGLHPQTLRSYEREGLVKPARRGTSRLYSEYDLERVRQIQRLTQEMGVNLAGVEVILNLLEQLGELREELEQLRATRLPVPTLTHEGTRRDLL
jgi:MerR family transcriptional regulator/heat shock protein HspR